MLFGILSTLILGFKSFLDSNERIEIQQEPNQGIRKSLINSIASSILGGTVGVLAAIIALKPFFKLQESLCFGILIGSINGFLFGGGIASIQHFLLRLFLFKDKHIPWNYAHFLNYCTENLILQRIGGRYRFIHRLLQDHLVQASLEKSFRRN